MTEPKKEDQPEECAKAARAANLVSFNRIGSTRRRWKRYRRGEEVEFSGTTMVVNEPVEVEVEETYVYRVPNNAADPYWKCTGHYLATIRALPPTRWRRFWAWLLRRPLSMPIPPATIAKEGK